MRVNTVFHSYRPIQVTVIKIKRSEDKKLAKPCVWVFNFAVAPATAVLHYPFVVTQIKLMLPLDYPREGFRENITA